MDRLYLEASKILRELDAKRESFRNLIFQSQYKNKKHLYKLCLETMKKKAQLREILAECSSLGQQEVFTDNEYLPLVLLYEYFYGVVGLKKCRNRTWRDAILCRETELISIKNRLSNNGSKATTSDGDSEVQDVRIPRYVRINTLKCQLDEVLAILQADGYVKIDVEEDTSKRYRKRILALESNEFCVDPDVENVLVFASGTDLHDYHLAMHGRLILQDKSSCLAAICLNPAPGDIVLDACAAPGMKTTHLAAIMQNQGRIFAIDKDERRVQTMHNLLEKYGVSCAKIMCGDFLALDYNDKKLQKITHILVDPPCSGSGIVNRGDAWTDSNDRLIKDERRINSLGNLQAMMLKRALTSFPNVRRVVYSTCSIYERENEMVIQEVLDTATAQGFQLIDAFPTWKHRGKGTYEFRSFCVRTDTKRDVTNGFFVATFER